MESEFPSNSNNPSPMLNKPDEKKIEQITTTTAIQKKKSLGKRFKETFTVNDSKSVLESVVFDIAIPALKDLIADMVSSTIERKLFGSTSSAGRRGGGLRGGGGYTAYNRISTPLVDSFRSELRNPDPRGYAPSRQARATHNFDEIIIPSRTEAIEVIERLFSIVDQYQAASVSDLYQMVGIESNYIDGNFGWLDMRGADVRRVRDGYMLILPRPVPLD